MKRHALLAVSIAGAVFWQAVAPHEAHAYLDPGSGSYLLQILLASVLASLFAVKIYWRKIIAFFSCLVAGKKPSGKDNG